MKSLYNIAGILPSQFRTSPVDCGIAWSEHRKVEKVRRDEEINVEVPPHNDALTEYLKETMAACMSKLMIMPKLMIDVNPADQGADQTVTTAFTLKPIDPQTIKVGDTVRLVGSRTITEWPHSNLEVGKDYKVIYVDRNCNEGMAISVSYNVNMKYFWIYDEDLMLVEPA